MKKLRFIILIFAAALINSCVSNDEFGLSPYKDIVKFEIDGQAGITTINKEEKKITIPIGEDVEIANLVPSLIEISNMATISPGKEEAQDFNNDVVYTVTAEDGSSEMWTVSVVSAAPNPQLPNSDFNLWYAVGKYYQPGESVDNTVWGTANKAMAIAGQANTNPVDLGLGDIAAKLRSEAAPLLVRMAAATLFTGKFTDGFPNATDPRSNIDFGTPFSARPDAFKVDYKYIPGASYEDAKGNVLPGGDECDIYVLLEKRDGDNVARVATGWFRSDVEVAEWKTIEIELKYGELSPSDSEFEYANIREGESWASAQDMPTHITVVFSSSALGDFFTGAIGSELWINNFELVY